MTSNEQPRSRTGKYARVNYGGGGSAYLANNPPPPLPTAESDDALMLLEDFDYAADGYRESAINQHIRYSRLAADEGLGRSGPEVGAQVRRIVHQQVIEEFGDPREMPSFARAVATVQRGSFDHDRALPLDGAVAKVRGEMLRSSGRKSRGDHLLATVIREAVHAAAAT